MGKLKKGCCYAQTWIKTYDDGTLDEIMDVLVGEFNIERLLRDSGFVFVGEPSYVEYPRCFGPNGDDYFRVKEYINRRTE